MAAKVECCFLYVLDAWKWTMGAMYIIFGTANEGKVTQVSDIMSLLGIEWRQASHCLDSKRVCYCIVLVSLLSYLKSRMALVFDSLCAKTGGCNFRQGNIYRAQVC